MEKIIPRPISEEVKESYLDYAMSVIISRALPDIRDGLKPVARRILWTMWQDGLKAESKFKKSASVVGSTLARYHPHGDQAVYETIARLTQDFSLRYPLIKGQGNWGSIDGDSPASMRYTECKLAKISSLLLEDIEKETVDWQNNYDGSLKEPTVLPAKLPNLLVNGTIGIAVGMATNIPPHNLGEVIDGLVYFLDQPEAKIEEILKYIKGPDFPTGGYLLGRKELKEIYTTGRGKIIIRGKVEVEEEKNKNYLLISEIPYQVNKAELVKKIALLGQEKIIEGIKNIRDESSREGLRIIIELKKEVIPQKIINQLYKHTELQKAFHFNMVALVDGIQPQTLSLREILSYYLKHREEVVLRRTSFDLKKAKERAHILRGLVKAIGKIDQVIALIKKSKNIQEASLKLQKFLKIDEIQAKAILEIKLQNLAKLEREKIENELKEKEKLIKKLEEILTSKEKLKNIIKKELLEIKEKFADKRRTHFLDKEITPLKEEDYLTEKEEIILLSKEGFIKRIPLVSFRSQKRGGQGISLFGSQNNDSIEKIVKTTTLSNLLFFTDKGKVYQIKTYQIPESARLAKGRAVLNFLEIGKEEKILAILSYKEKIKEKKKYLIIATKNGLVKKTPIEEFYNVRKNGLLAIKLNKNDSLVSAKFSSGEDEILLTTKNGLSIRFKEKEIRPMARFTSGVTGIKLKEGDEVISLVVVNQENKNSDLLFLTSFGFAKRTKASQFRGQKRGGQGIKGIKLTKRNGNLVFVDILNQEESLIIATQKGMIIKTPLSSIRKISRQGQGVKAIKLKSGDFVQGGIIV